MEGLRGPPRNLILPHKRVIIRTTIQSGPSPQGRNGVSGPRSMGPGEQSVQRARVKKAGRTTGPTGRASPGIGAGGGAVALGNQSLTLSKPQVHHLSNTFS